MGKSPTWVRNIITQSSPLLRETLSQRITNHNQNRVLDYSNMPNFQRGNLPQATAVIRPIHQEIPRTNSSHSKTTVNSKIVRQKLPRINLSQ